MTQGSLRVQWSGRGTTDVPALVQGQGTHRTINVGVLLFFRQSCAVVGVWSRRQKLLLHLFFRASIRARKRPQRKMCCVPTQLGILTDQPTRSSRVSATGCRVV